MSSRGWRPGGMAVGAGSMVVSLDLRNTTLSGEGRTAKAGAGRTARNTADLGRKGRETRLSLMQAARKLLDSHSPINISAAAISQEAGTSPATFYVYFDNVEDVFWSLCDAIVDDTSDLFADYAFLRTDARLEDDALTFVRGYSDIWARHGPLMLYRNMEADRGNKRFFALVLRIGLPILEGLIDRIVEREPTLRRADANAEAVVFIAGIDRVASTLHRWPKDSLMPDVLLRAEARVLTRLLRRS